VKQNQNFFKKAFIESIILTLSALLGVIVFCVYTKSPVPNLLSFIIGGFCGCFFVEFIFFCLMNRKALLKIQLQFLLLLLEPRIH
jgi:hypothetical protein